MYCCLNSNVLLFTTHYALYSPLTYSLLLAPRPYQVTHTTFVKGHINRDHFLPAHTDPGMTPATTTATVVDAKINGSNICSNDDNSVSNSSSSAVSSVLRTVFGAKYHDDQALPTQIFLAEKGAKVVRNITCCNNCL
jgi:hypothetical protein